LGSLGALLGLSWALLGLSGLSWGSLGPLLGLSWALLGPSWGSLGLSWGLPGFEYLAWVRLPWFSSEAQRKLSEPQRTPAQR
jgi:hypothetical protein